MSGGVPAGEVARLQAAWPVMMRKFGHVFGNLDDGYYPEVEDMRKAVAAFATPTPPIEGRDADVERVSKAIYDAVEPLSGDPIAVVLHNSDHLFWDDRLPGNNDIERQLAAVRIICDTAARAALQALGERE